MSNSIKRKLRLNKPDKTKILKSKNRKQKKCIQFQKNFQNLESTEQLIRVLRKILTIFNYNKCFDMYIDIVFYNNKTVRLLTDNFPKYYAHQYEEFEDESEILINYKRYKGIIYENIFTYISDFVQYILQKDFSKTELYKEKYKTQAVPIKEIIKTIYIGTKGYKKKFSIYNHKTAQINMI